MYKYSWQNIWLTIINLDSHWSCTGEVTFTKIVPREVSRYETLPQNIHDLKNNSSAMSITSEFVIQKKFIIVKNETKQK